MFSPYVLFEFPSNVALKYFTPSKWIARIMVSWGIVTICTAAVSSYTGLIICRIFLGICEAGVSFQLKGRPTLTCSSSPVSSTT